MNLRLYLLLVLSLTIGLVAVSYQWMLAEKHASYLEGRLAGYNTFTVTEIASPGDCDIPVQPKVPTKIKHRTVKHG